MVNRRYFEQRACADSHEVGTDDGEDEGGLGRSFRKISSKLEKIQVKIPVVVMTHPMLGPPKGPGYFGMATKMIDRARMTIIPTHTG